MTEMAVALVVVGLAFAAVQGLAMRFLLLEARRLDAVADACRAVARECELKTDRLDKRQDEFRDELTRLNNRIPGR